MSSIVIVGANFAGLKAAQSLPARHRVTVIDQSSSFEWLPNVHELVSQTKKPADLRLERRRVVAAAGHRFVRGRVEHIDAEARVATLASGKTIAFEACVVAVGGVHDTLGTPGADRHAMPFKSVGQCAAIGKRLRELTRGRGAVSIAIVGGGLEGIEALGEILRRYRTRPHFSVTVVEVADRLLPNAPAGLDQLIRAHCEELPVDLRTKARVARVDADQLHLEGGGRIRFDVCIWSAGAAAPPLLHASGLSLAPKKWAPVHETLQSMLARNVFVVGDAAELPEPLAKQAYHALQMGEHAALNCERFLEGRDLVPLSASPKPMLATFGDIDTFLVYGNTALAGTGLASVKEAIFQVTMAQLDPPTSTSSLAGFGERLGRGIASIFPALAPARLARLPRVRVV